MTLLCDMTAFSLSSDAILAQAKALPIGGKLAFVPSAVLDGSPIQASRAATIHYRFWIRRIDADEVPPEYELDAQDAEDHFLFLVSSELQPEVVQLSMIEY